MLCIEIDGSVRISIDGTLVAITSKKSKALVAMLALEPGHRLSREWLKHHLWSDRSQDQASASLRQCISTIKKHLFSVSTAEYFIADSQSVCLVPNRITVVLSDSAANILFDLNIRDKNFVAWRERHVLNQRTIKNSIDVFNPKETNLQDLDFSANVRTVGLLPTIDLTGASRYVSCASEEFLDRFCQCVIDNGFAMITDYRPIFPGVNSGNYFNRIKRADIFLQLSIQRSMGSTRLNCKYYDSLENILLWSGDCILKENSGRFNQQKLMEFVNEVVDCLESLLFGALMQGNMEGREASKLALLAIAEIIKARDGDLNKANNLLIQAYELNRNSVYLAWRTQVYAFLIGERQTDNLAELREELREIVAIATETGKFNPLTLCLTGHALSFVFQDFEKALKLFKLAMMQGPSQAICYDMAATTNVYVSNKQEAHEQAMLALSLGRYSPFLYNIEVTCAMACALMGRLDEAIQFTQSVLRKKPSYTVALRYDIAAKSHKGYKYDALESYHNFVSIERDFSISMLKSNDYPVCTKSETSEFLFSGYKNLGI